MASYLCHKVYRLFVGGHYIDYLSIEWHVSKIVGSCGMNDAPFFTVVFPETTGNNNTLCFALTIFHKS